MYSDEEYDYIREYLEGEIDWELLVKVIGEDMARGVRIVENFYSVDEQSVTDVVVNHIKDKDELSDIKKEIGKDIMQNGYIAQCLKESFGLNRKGKRQ